MVRAPARALLVGATAPNARIDAGLRGTARCRHKAARLLELWPAGGVLLISVLHLIPDQDGPQAIVTRLMEAAPFEQTHLGGPVRLEQIEAVEWRFACHLRYRVVK